MKTHCTIIILIIVLALFVIYGLPADQERMLRERPTIDIEKVINMERGEIEGLPRMCAADIIYDLCQEVKRLRKESK